MNAPRGEKEGGSEALFSLSLSLMGSGWITKERIQWGEREKLDALLPFQLNFPEKSQNPEKRRNFELCKKLFANTNNEH